MKIPFVESRAELLRWALSGVAVLALHGAVTAAMINWNDEEVGEPAAAMVVDLAPFPMSPQESSTEALGSRQQLQGENTPATPVSEAKEVVEERVETQQTQEEVEQEVPPVENPEVALAALPPKPQQQVQQESQVGDPVTTAPQVIPDAAPAEVAAAQVQGMPTENRSKAIPTWRAAIAVLLERNKRYPDDAKNARGIAEIVFSIDRRGHLVSSRISKTSGSVALDREAIEMIKRAQPFPPPPTDVSGSEVSLTVPVKFNVR
jgi:protein TonB